jgi:hypothetical protein
MKSNKQQSLFFTPHVLKSVKPEEPVVKVSEQSPYLKAILSEKRSSAPGGSLPNSSMAAALRYIANNK